MNMKFYSLSILLSGLMLLGGLSLKGQFDDDPNLDRIPEWYLQQQANRNPMPSSVVTIDGYDNYFLGVDFAEGHISEDPTSPGKYFVAFNIDEAHITLDGHDWTDPSISWGGYNIRGDVLSAYDGDGNLFYENMYGSSIQGCVLVKSTDNGQTWGNPVVAISGNDKNWLAADQTDGPYANYVYTVMTNSGSGNFSRSTNGGASFTTTFQPGTQSLPGMMVCVGAWNSVDGGAVYVVTNSGSSFASNYTFYQSLDGGATFSLKSQQQFAGYVGTDVNGRNSVQNMRTRPYPFIAADNSNGPYRGRLYLVYASNQPAGNGNKPDIFSRYSDDGGATWSSAVVVNDDFPSNTNHQWHPAVWTDLETGRLYVQWMDTRDTPTSDSALIYATYSDNGGQSFATNHAISNEKMKINCSTCGGGGTPRYQGDYNAIVSNSVTSMSTWADFRNGNFGSYTAYFPDYAMLVTPSNAQTSGNIAIFSAEVPSVKLYDQSVTFTAVVETPPSGAFTVNYPNGNTLASFPGTLPIEVESDGNVPVGFYEVTITGEGPNGTPIHIRTATVEVVPLSAPTANFSASTTQICAGETVDFFDQSTSSPTSWEWTFFGGDPETSTDQNPTGITYDTPGFFDVKLVVSNSVGSDSLTETSYIEVLALPAAPTASNEVVCFGDPVPELIAQGSMIQWYDDPDLTNMVHSGDTLATGQTLPGVYTYYVTQSPGACESPATMVTLTIQELPFVGLDPIDPVCISEPAFALTGGSPPGGIYSGNGVSNDSLFDPAAAGVGTHDITYTFTDPQSCTNDTTQQITIFDLPTVTLDPWPDVCINDDPITLSGGMPEGGVYSGTGVNNGIFDPVAVGIGTHTITYTYEDSNGCSNLAEQTITVNDIPQPDLGPDTAICAHQSITLDATLAGATAYEWYPGGQTTAQISVDSTGVGIGSQMYIVYVTDGNTCIGTDSVTVDFSDCTGIGELAGVNTITLYPNPGEGEFNLLLSTEKPIEVNISVYNNFGVSVYEEGKRPVNGAETISIDLGNQPSGVYLLNVYNQSGRWIEKLVIRK
ncbi:MAG: T9SS type A sorting domain-containing protein [Bacteroidales bacterium]|nr:T9SS type A sorting domain-containing protein [Bacteroidales bacterium]